MKRARNLGTEEDHQDAQTRGKNRNTSVCQRHTDSCFFFVKLLDGTTVTADVPLSFTADELLQHVAARMAKQCRDRQLYLLVGRHNMEGHQTLQQAGVSRDCHVRVLSRVLSTACPELFEVQEQLLRLGRLLEGQPAASASAAGCRQALFHEISALLERVCKLQLNLNTSYISELQQLVQLISVVAQSRGASPSEVQQAAIWLHCLADCAAACLGHPKEQVTCCSAGMRVTQVTCCSAAAVLLELWLAALASYMQLCIYHRRQMRPTDGQSDDAGCPKVCDALQRLLSWLEVPWRAAMPDSLLAPGTDLSQKTYPSWAGSGQCCLVALMAGADWDKELAGVAALLQALLLITADYALCSYQAAFRQLPGLSPDVMPAAGTALAADDAPLAKLPQALVTLAHAALLLQPVLPPNDVLGKACTAALRAAKAMLTGLRLCTDANTSFAALQQSQVQQAAAAMQEAVQGEAGWPAAPGCALAAQLMAKVVVSATLRLDPNQHHIPIVTMEGIPKPLQVLRPAWDFLPLLEAVLQGSERFAGFAAAAGLPIAARARNLSQYLPASLTEGAALLQLLEAWSLLSQLAQGGMDSTGCCISGSVVATPAMITKIGDVLNQPLVSSWLELSMNQLTPNKVSLHRSQPGSVSASSSLDPAGTAAALLDLLAWAPGLEQLLPRHLRSAWLQCLLFPEPAEPFGADDESDDDDGGEVRLTVRRQHLLEDSYEELLSLEPRQLRRRLAVSFVGEDAYGSGVLKEWLVQLAGVLFEPAAGLFSQGASDRALQHPSPTAAVQPDWQKYSRLAGRVVGLALRHRVPLGISLSSAFYKAVAAAAASPPAWLYSNLPGNSIMNPMIQRQLRQQLSEKPAWQLPHPWQTADAAAAALTASKRRSAAKQQQQQQLEAALLEWESCSQGRSRGATTVLAYDMYAGPDFGASFVERRWRQQPNLADLQQIDPEMVPGLQSLLRDPGLAGNLGLTFTATAAAPTAAGEAAAAGGQDVDLVPGGSQQAVTAGNVQQYVAVLLDHKLSGCSEQVLWFFAGLADVAEPAAAALSRGRLLLPLSAAHFDAALRGSAAPLSVAEWRRATTACSSLQQEQHTLAMFWQVLSGLSQEQRRELLRFWTGISYLPATGFSGLGRKLLVMAAGPPPGSSSTTAAAAVGEGGAGVIVGTSDNASDGGLMSEREEEEEEEDVLFRSDAEGADSDEHGSYFGDDEFDREDITNVLTQIILDEMNGMQPGQEDGSLLSGRQLKLMVVLLRAREQLLYEAGSLAAVLAAAAQAAQEPLADLRRELQLTLCRVRQLQQRAELLQGHADAADVVGAVDMLELVFQQVLAQDGVLGQLRAGGAVIVVQLMSRMEMQLRLEVHDVIRDTQQQQQQQQGDAVAERSQTPASGAAANTAAPQLATDAPDALAARELPGEAAAVAATPVEQDISEQGSGSNGLDDDVVMTDVQQPSAAAAAAAVGQDAAAVAAEQEATATPSEAAAAAAGAEEASSPVDAAVQQGVPEPAAAAAAAGSSEEAGSSDKAMEDAPVAPGAAAPVPAAAAAAAPSEAAAGQHEQQLAISMNLPQQQQLEQQQQEMQQPALGLPAAGAVQSSLDEEVSRLQGVLVQRLRQAHLRGLAHAVIAAGQPALATGLGAVGAGAGEQQAGDAVAPPPAAAGEVQPPADAPATEQAADAAALPAAAHAVDDLAAAAQPAAAEQPAAGAASPAASRAKLLQLPRAHTCFMQLLLPTSYKGADEMQEALLVALQNVDYFGMA